METNQNPEMNKQKPLNDPRMADLRACNWQGKIIHQILKDVDDAFISWRDGLLGEKLDVCLMVLNDQNFDYLANRAEDVDWLMENCLANTAGTAIRFIRETPEPEEPPKEIRKCECCGWESTDVRHDHGKDPPDTPPMLLCPMCAELNLNNFYLLNEMPLSVKINLRLTNQILSELRELKQEIADARKANDEA